MNEIVKDNEKITMRTKFPDRLINKLPKGTKAQNDCPSSEKKNCSICGGWHHPRIVHLDYIGHAALTDRMLDVDPLWNWEPLAFKDGLPAFDSTGGLWIRLTVNNVTRLGYGNAQAKSFMDVGAREKEVIGDALRNAAMRFGAALDLWFKGDLHQEDNTIQEEIPTIIPITKKQKDDLNSLISDVGADMDGFLNYMNISELDQLQEKYLSNAIQALEKKRTSTSNK